MLLRKRKKPAGQKTLSAAPREKVLFDEAYRYALELCGDPGVAGRVAKSYLDAQNTGNPGIRESW